MPEREKTPPETPCAKIPRKAGKTPRGKVAKTPRRKGKKTTTSRCTRRPVPRIARTTGVCDLLDGYALQCRVSEPAAMSALGRLAAAGDCQFDMRCPRCRECPVAAQTRYKPRKVMILPANDKSYLQRATRPIGSASVDFDGFWY